MPPVMSHALHSVLGHSESLSTLLPKLHWELLGLNQLWDCSGS